MRSARDIFMEIRRTLKAELDVVIPTKFAKHGGTSAVNETMARILFDCYMSNLSLFSGHERGGYVLAKLPGMVMYVHPSCALTYIEQMPKWVIYEQVIVVIKDDMQQFFGYYK